jgi:hypothetical protein
MPRLPLSAETSGAPPARERTSISQASADPLIVSPHEQRIRERLMAAPTAIAHLGQPVFYCPARPLADYFAAQGGTSISVYYLRAVALCLFGPLVPTAILIGMISDSLPNWLNSLVFMCSYLLWTLVFFWLLVFRGQRNYLILHQGGFRYRISSFAHGRVRFADLKQITLLGDTTHLDRFGFRSSEIIGRGQPYASYRLAPRSRAILKLKDGREYGVDGFGVRYEPHDFVKVLNIIDENHPGLISIDG